MNKDKLISKAMSELGKRSGAKKTPEQMRAMVKHRTKQSYVDAANRMWEKRRAKKLLDK